VNNLTSWREEIKKYDIEEYLDNLRSNDFTVDEIVTLCETISQKIKSGGSSFRGPNQLKKILESLKQIESEL
jgi:hypothetical protein